MNGSSCFYSPSSRRFVCRASRQFAGGRKAACRLAIASARAKAGDALRDGINYLINVKENGIKQENVRSTIERTRENERRTVRWTVGSPDSATLFASTTVEIRP